MSALQKQDFCRRHNLKGKSMARNVYGLDLGTYEIKVYDKKKDTIWKEKNAIAIEDKTKVLAVGNEAYEMYEKAPGNIEVAFPMKAGVISRFHDMQYVLQNLLKKEHPFARGGEYVIAVPTDVTELEKRAFFDLVVHSTAKAKEINIVERGLAHCVGLGIDVQNTKGVLIVDFGGETTEISVIAAGGLVFNRILKIGGVSMDEAIANLVRHNYEFLIGRTTAENLRKKFGVFGGDSHSSMKVAGRNLITGVPMQQEVPISVVRAAMKGLVTECIGQIKQMLDRTPPEVLKSIREDGIYLTGGLAYLPGLGKYIEEMTGYTVKIAKRPDVCAVEGLSRIIMSKELKKLTYSMLNEGYRWMR